uniref:SH3 domain-containing protein n=1 Tax=Plectus sambesii TaxID=2011161 RepID=A0A914W7X9_9BILA
MSMIMDTGSSDLRSLIETEIPEGRMNLESSYANLERVAAYCEANYLQATDKKAAFEETKRYTVQSLASVAYQINTLASSLLQTLELQTDKIGNMESQVNNIAQIIDIHKEKVARREIGVLTANKVVQRQHKIITPAHQERPQRYQRTPIDYSALDDLGHGVKLTSQQNTQRTLLARTGSTISGGSSASSGGGVSHHANFPGYEHLLPKGLQSQHSTMSRTSANREPHYRTPIVTAQQQMDSVQRYPTQQGNAHGQRAMLTSSQQMFRQPSSAGNYSSVSVNSRTSNFQMEVDAPRVQPLPLPPPQLASVAQYRLSASSADGLPPPPMPDDLSFADDHRSSPPLPPPPMDESVIPEMPQYGTYLGRRGDGENLPDWVPRNYLEKAVALYDYDAQKPDELSFQENSVIYVLCKNEDG